MINRLFALSLCLWITNTSVASEWSGHIVIEEQLIGPQSGSTDQGELLSYRDRLTEHLARNHDDMRSQPAVVMRTLREDAAYFHAELERAVMATGGTITVNRSDYLIKGSKTCLRSGGLILVTDRSTNQANATVGGRSESTTLSLLPPLRPLPAEKSTTQFQGHALYAFRIDAEGHSCQVLVAPDLPNPYALTCTTNREDDKDSFSRVLSELPGLPVELTYTSGDIRYQWTVVTLEERILDDREFVLK